MLSVSSFKAYRFYKKTELLWLGKVLKPYTSNILEQSRRSQDLKDTG